MEIEGIIKVINKEEEVSEKFKKRDIVVTTDEKYPQHITVQFTQDGCDLVDKVSVGDKVKVSINVRGKEYTDKKTGELKYFNSLQGWKIESLGASSTPVATSQAVAVIPATNADDDLPF